MDRMIDRMPPTPTGDAARDNSLMADYMAYFREQMNFILTGIYQKMRKEDANNGGS